MIQIVLRLASNRSKMLPYDTKSVTPVDSNENLLAVFSLFLFARFCRFEQIFCVSIVYLGLSVLTGILESIQSSSFATFSTPELFPFARD